jgi:hypothetical protein
MIPETSVCWWKSKLCTKIKIIAETKLYWCDWLFVILKIYIGNSPIKQFALQLSIGCKCTLRSANKRAAIQKVESAPYLSTGCQNTEPYYSAETEITFQPSISHSKLTPIY